MKRQTNLLTQNKVMDHWDKLPSMGWQHDFGPWMDGADGAKYKKCEFCGMVITVLAHGSTTGAIHYQCDPSAGATFDGPWHTHIDPKIGTITVVDDMGRTVAHWPQYGPRFAANANLIAQAPKMFEMLKNLLMALDQYEMDPRRHKSPVRQAARQVIRDATHGGE